MVLGVSLRGFFAAASLSFAISGVVGLPLGVGLDAASRGGLVWDGGGVDCADARPIEPSIASAVAVERRNFAFMCHSPESLSNLRWTSPSGHDSSSPNSSFQIFGCNG